MASFEVLLSRFLPTGIWMRPDLSSGLELVRHCGKEERWVQLDQAFRTALAQDDPRIRIVGIRGLSALMRAGAMPGTEFVSLLSSVTKDSAPTVQASAYLTLAAFDPLAWTPRLHALAKTMMASRLQDTPAVAARIMEEADEELRASFRESVVALARDGSPGARPFAAQVLSAMAQTGDGELLRALRGMLDEKDPVVRNQILSVVSKFGDDEALPALRAALSGPPQVFRHALALLTARGDHELLSVLRKLHAESTVSSQRKRLRNAIDALKGR